MSGTVYSLVRDEVRFARQVARGRLPCVHVATRLASTALPSCTARLTAMFHSLRAWAVLGKRSGGDVGP